jgi:hypothetical protein
MGHGALGFAETSDDGAVQATGLEVRRPEQLTGIFRARSCDIFTAPALHLPSLTYGMIACRRGVRFDGVRQPAS